MSKTISWPVRVTYIFIALALALSLVLVAIPAKTDADPGLTKWSKVTTPSEEDKVIVQNADVISFAAGATGDVIYAVLDGVYAWDDTVGVKAWVEGGATGNVEDVLEDGFGDAVFKSEDAGVTWDDITDEVQEEGMMAPMMVEVAPDDDDFAFVTGYADDDAVDGTITPASDATMVIGSDDGGNDFSDMVFTATTERILCIAVAPEADDTFNVAVGTDAGSLYRYEVGGTFGGAWKDTITYLGWDTGSVGTTTAVVAVAFSPNFAGDDTVVAITTDGNNTYQQSGIWGTTKAWNNIAGDPFPSNAVRIMDAPPYMGIYNPASYQEWDLPAGIAMPEDFTGYDSGLRHNWVYLNYDANLSSSFVPASFKTAFGEVGQVFRIKGSTVKYAGIRCEPWDTSTTYPLIASISMYGEIEDGNLMVGLTGQTDCCKGVQVYRTSEWPIDYCCPQWSSAKKPPTGQANCLVSYVAGGDKAYAATSECSDDGSEYDESAFSLSEVEEVGKYWNQPSLVDTFIDFLSDMAVNPSCGTIYIFSINDDNGCDCDSVWSSTDDGDSYLRVFCKSLTSDFGLIRTAPEEIEEVLTVYLVDQGTKVIYWNDDSGLTNWSNRKASTLDNVWDLAVESEDTIYALSANGKVSTSAKHGGPGSWSSAKDAKVNDGHSIVCRDGHVLVGGTAGKVGYSDDSASSFTKLDDIGDGLVHCAFDTYFDENDYVYAAISGGDNGVYRTTIADADFEDMDAWTTVDYFGVVTELSKDGNPKTSASTGGVLYAAYYDGAGSGVARQLSPAAATCCGDLSWDYLTAKLDADAAFTLEPTALKICGCLTSATNSNLYAIDVDDDGYQMSDGKDGTPWVYEDCFGKFGVELSVVADGATVASDPCVCANEKFVLEWDRLCNECEYDIDISLNSAFTQIVLDEGDLIARYGAGAGGFYDPPKNAEPSVVIWEGALDCNTTYYWRVRSRYAETTEIIRSFWSDTWSFTVEAGPTVAIDLMSPDDGATNLPLTGIGFTWTSVADATSYDWVLSANADLSSPVETKTGLADTAYTYTGTLETSTTYFWRVTAMKDDNVFSESDISTFITAPEPVPPPPPPAEPLPPVTPAWVWVVIGLGAVLVIVVIVLIFRTRRV